MNGLVVDCSNVFLVGESVMILIMEPARLINSIVVMCCLPWLVVFAYNHYYYFNCVIIHRTSVIRSCDLLF